MNTQPTMDHRPLTKSEEETVGRIPFDRLGSFPALFEQYCTNHLAVSDFFAGDFRNRQDRIAAAERAAGFDRDREALVQVLLEQNARWGMPDCTRRNVEALRDPQSVAVVTGQQVGILGGPLYTILKTVTALQLAGSLAEETGRTVVPVFWLEGEDHDFDEVSSVSILKGNDVLPLQYAPGNLPQGGNAGPVGRLPLTDAIADLLDGLDQALQPSDFKEQLLENVRAAYRPGTTLLDAFATLMSAFFPDAGLVLIDPADAQLKRIAAPLFRREIEQYRETAERLRTTSERLSERYHAQVSARPTNLFLTDESGRHSVDADGDRFQVRGTETVFDRNGLLQLLDRHPEQFSPNVVLRPLVQDLLLPTALYVGGPAEVSYFAQFRTMYEWAGIPMPLIYPRASVTLIESKIQKVLDRYGLSVADFDQDFEQLFQQVVVGQMDVDVDALFGTATGALHDTMNGLKQSVQVVDKT
ncbi:MAG TPA: bacillithiol biosynthesis cysteine-adding enzyme BshC, partial [Rhodothermales bacterium]|nr:bacillithiol biosynthesis cysteine-adding enzyme BshC [Rhodothermales bacterium]